ncbi:MAG: hypothetical protein Q8M15_12400 [Bacteroidota bacterium]|nr:hypothetical protein [Bacteroidota bacterium]
MTPKLKDFIKYNINDTVLFKHTLGDTITFRVISRINDYERLHYYQALPCGTPDKLVEYVKIVLRSDLRNLNLEFGTYCSSSHDCSFEYDFPNTMRAKINNIYFFYWIPYDFVSNISMTINEVVYHGIYKSYGKICSGNSNSVKSELIFNSDNGVLKIQLDSNDYYEIIK